MYERFQNFIAFFKLLRETISHSCENKVDAISITIDGCYDLHSFSATASIILS